MVGDEVVRFAHESHQLLDPAVTPGQRFDQPPAQLMRLMASVFLEWF
jgi:hypothetical protein